MVKVKGMKATLDAGVKRISKITDTGGRTGKTLKWETSLQLTKTN
jgi:hypothetical protein